MWCKVFGKKDPSSEVSLYHDNSNQTTIFENENESKCGLHGFDQVLLAFELYNGFACYESGAFAAGDHKHCHCFLNILSDNVHAYGCM